MPENTLSLIGSEQFRNRCLIKNLPPYNVEGNYSPAQGPLNTEITLTVNSVVDTENISNTIYVEAQDATIINKWGAAKDNLFDGAQLINTVSLDNPINVVVNNDSVSAAFPPKQEYDFSDAKLDLVNEFFIDDAEVINKYLPFEGYDDMYIVTDVFIKKDANFNGPYPEFVQGTYSLLDIISSNNVTNNDSYIQKIGAERLRESFEERVFEELRKNTLGRLNIINQPDLSLFVTGQVPLTDKNWTITVPDGLLDNLVALTQRITGTYYPASPIEGEYFSNPERKATKVGQLLSNAVRNLSNSKTPSEKFIANTGSGQKSTLFANLDYNRYKPPYNRKVNFYVGDENSSGALVSSPANDVPKDAFGNLTSSPVYGPDRLASLFDNNVPFQFGLAGVPFDERPVFDGGFVWTSKRTSKKAFKNVGPGGEIFGRNEAYGPLNSSYSQVLSTDYEFRPGSILDTTQRLIDSTPRRGKDKLGHVGNAINQVSKVFHDGYKEITKGSKVRTYVNEKGKEVGKEYGRVFAKDNPYFAYNNLQSTIANTSGGETNGNIRRFSYSVLDSTYNLNITPYKNGGTSVKDGKVKKYMFSIENLAWKNSSDFESLPACEKGPNGGRIMWFPPYDLTFNDSSNAGWNPTNFLGRPEPIYTYQNSSRSGSIGFKIVVDHPSVLNLIVNKELAKEDNYTTQQVVNSFFAGLKKYDIYELAKKFNSLSLTTIQDAYSQVLENVNATKEDIQAVANGLNGDNGSFNNSQNIEVTGWSNARFYFCPIEGVTNSDKYDIVYDGVKNILQTFESDPVVNFSTEVVENNYSILTDIQEQIAAIFTEKKGNVKITLEPSVCGVSSNDMYDSIIKFFGETYLDGDSAKTLQKHIDDKSLNFVLLSTPVETFSVLSQNQTPFKPLCAQPGYNANDIVNSFACASMGIKDIVVTPSPPTAQGDPQNSENRPNQNSNLGLPTTPNTDIIDKTKNISKKILRELLTESDYFEVVKKDNPFVFDSIKQKIKYFNPAFHSITPEGLNSRITFLNQCVRPGKTMPTKVNGELVYNDAFNTNFGTPPVLVLRIGDFYNTKIIPDSVSFTYENLDINPEGIGVQPMIATVQIQFKMIGGHGLKEPVERLQNALSFNYYANTEMYDDRADVTEDTTAIDNDLISAIFNNEPLANMNDVNSLNQNDGGDVIGQITNVTANTGSTQTGTISYKLFFDGIVEQTKNYFEETNKFVSSVINEYGLGVLKQLSSERDYSEGKINDLQGPSVDTIIFGKLVDWESKINMVGTILKQHVTFGDDPFTIGIDAKNGSNSDKNVVQKNFKTLIDEKTSNGFVDLGSKITDLANKQATYIQNFRKLDYVLTSTDGKLLSNNKPKIYNLSGDTISGLTSDYGIISSGLTGFINFLKDNKSFIDYSVSSGFFKTAYFEPLYSGTIQIEPDGDDNLIFTLFAYDIIDDGKRETLKNNLIKDLSSPTSGSTIDAVTSVLDNLKNYFNNEINKEKEVINASFEDSSYQLYKEYNPQRTDGTAIKGIVRDVTFVTGDGTNQQQDRLKNIYSSQNSGPNKKFNDQKTFLG